MKLTKQGILDLNAALNSCGNLTGVKFAYAVARNIAKLKPEIEAIQKAYEASPEFKAYDKERIDLATKYSKKVDGKPQIENNEYVLDDIEKFEAEFKELKEKHKPAIEARQKLEEDFKEFLKEEVEVDLHKLLPEFLPSGISASQTTGILPIIQEELKN